MNLFFKSSVIVSFCLFSSLGWGHARLVTPTPRSNDSGIKSGPCGGLSRSLNPTVLQGGQSLAISWQETVNHPGKFLFALSMNNDTFSTSLASVVDNQNGGGLPHSYSTIHAQMFVSSQALVALADKSVAKGFSKRRPSRLK